MVPIYHWFVPHRIVWEQWFAWWNEEEFYYDVWCDGL